MTSKKPKLRVSKAVVFFKERLLNKYDLDEYKEESDGSVIMFGLYNKIDLDFYLSFPGKIILIWCGTDARIADKSIIKTRPAKHIATSRFISNSLSGLDHRLVPITPVEPVMNIRPNKGNFIYHYGDRPIHRPELIPEIEKRTGLKVIHTNENSFSGKDLEDVYEKCFVGLRLTDHDGMSCTVLELGLMGRRSIFNGGYVTNIPWNSIDDVCESIVKEYEVRPDPENVAKSIHDYINIDESWMEHE